MVWSRETAPTARTAWFETGAPASFWNLTAIDANSMVVHLQAKFQLCSHVEHQPYHSGWGLWKWYRRTCLDRAPVPVHSNVSSCAGCGSPVSARASEWEIPRSCSKRTISVVSLCPFVRQRSISSSLARHGDKQHTVRPFKIRGASCPAVAAVARGWCFRCRTQRARGGIVRGPCGH